MKPKHLIFVLAVAAAGAAVGGLMAASASNLHSHWQVIRRRAVFVGTYANFLGYRASYFLDTQTRQCIGPLDLQSYPEPVTSAPQPGYPDWWFDPAYYPIAPPSIGSAPQARSGQAGEVAYYTVANDANPDPGHGYLVSFTADPEASTMPDPQALADSVKDPFLLGLFAGQSAIQEEALKRASALSNNAADFNPMLLGFLYSADAPRFRALMEKFKGADETWNLSLIYLLMHSDIHALAQEPGPLPNKGYRWTALLPPLARAWLEGGDARLAAALSALLKEHRFIADHGPNYQPPGARYVSKGPMKNGPNQLSGLDAWGPFIKLGLTDDAAILELVALRDPAFAASLKKAFTTKR
jgi:hypothetical protein